ncbi:helix-turn-helix transcriptional regulator [Lactobacillus delbrueckii]|uniref:helix-turn-helix transcriptional regulator n=1 Tax=Lactobacillus delbrueckii TaxID=1584 RepID=UPI0037C85C14
MEDFELSAYIGKQIKSLREKKGWTTQDLADKLHTSRVTVTRYETGARKANQDMLYKMSELFNVSIDDFFPPRDNEKQRSETVEQALSHVMSFDGKPVTDHDRAILQQIAEAYLKGRDQDEGDQ